VTGERPDLCARCGECCRTRPGAEDPERFLADADPAAALARALATGDWVLARHLGVAYPRPATLDERAGGTVHTGAETSPCVFLEARGCRLSFAGRPRMCRDLEPWANGDCQATWDLPDAAEAWAPWQGLVHQALRRLPGSPLAAGRVQPVAKE
jgi:Fe-S-cluster containining protein